MALLQARDDERRSIARDLHDVTAQLLLRLEFDLHAIRSNHGLFSDQAQHDAHEIIAQLQQQVRCVSYLLHPPELETLGLHGALETLAEGMSARTGIDITFKSRGFPQRTSPELELSLFRIGQEALMNVFKHSGSCRAEMRLHCDSKWLCLRIRDFGIGRKARDAITSGIGVGLGGMKARMAALGGKISVRPLEGGTSVTAVARYPIAA